MMLLTAADILQSRLLPLKDMILLDAGYDDTNGITQPEKRPIVESLRQAVVLLPVAFFEDFLRMAVEQFLDYINAKEPRICWAKLPLELRRTHVFDAPLLISRKPPDGDDDNYQMRSLEQFRSTFEKILSPMSAPDRYSIVTEAFTNTNSNPSSDTVKMMFKKIGIANVFTASELITSLTALNPIYSNETSIKIKLNAIVEMRHGVAHGRPASTLTRSELSDNMLFLEAFAQGAQDTAEALLERMSRQIP